MNRLLSRIGSVLLLGIVIPACGSGGGTALPGAWARTYGGGGADLAGINSRLLVLGQSYVFGARLQQTTPWIVRVSLDGSFLWQKTYGGAGSDLMSLDATSDGGIVVAGQTTVMGAGGSDAWVMRLDGNGAILWQKTYGGPGNDQGWAIRSTSDGGFILLAASDTFSGTVKNLWILKLNGDGSVAWQKTYIHTNSSDAGGDIVEVPTGGYIVVSGQSFGPSFDEAWVLRLNGDGTIAWQKRYGTSNLESSTTITPTQDGGFLFAGSSLIVPNPPDAWAVKLDSAGAIVWQKTYGGVLPEVFSSVQASSDGTFLATGTTDAPAGGSIGGHAWAVHLLADGSIDWQKKYGGSQTQDGISLRPSPFGGLMLQAQTGSFGAGVVDAWLLHLDADGACGPLATDTSVLPVNGTAVATTTTNVAADTSVIPANATFTAVDSFAVSIPQVP